MPIFFIRKLFPLATIVLLAVIPLSVVRANYVGELQNEVILQDSFLTPTPTSSPTTTPVPPTFTSAAPAGLLTPALLDNFNRADGQIGPNWSGDTVDSATIFNNQLVVGESKDIFWNVNSFSINQEAYITLTDIDANASEIGLILKGQSNSGFGFGVIQVLLYPTGNYIQVWTYHASQYWVQHGGNISVASDPFVNGDQLRAQALSNGDVTIYKNNTTLGTINVSTWPFFGNGGYIGLFNIDVGTTVLDNFGGGSMAGAPTLTPTPIPCTDPLTCSVVSAIPAYWRCNIPECITGDWLGTVIAWPSWAAVESNGRTGNNSKTVYSYYGDQTLYAYMGSWAQGCQITAQSGTVLIIEWQYGTDTWEEFYINPGQTHTVNLVSPQNGVLIEGPDGILDPFSVSLTNCNPPTPVPTATFTPSPTPTPLPTSIITMGETNILPGGPSSNLGDVISAQQATLSARASLQSISLYVNNPAGQLRLGLYGDSGGYPGNLIIQSPSMLSATGWNTYNFPSPHITLDAGNYWLAFLPEDDALTLPIENTGINHYYNHPFGNMISPFPNLEASGTFHYSVFATLIINDPTIIEIKSLDANPQNFLVTPLRTVVILLISASILVWMAKPSKRHTHK
ncbi:MAG: hypothetical protein H6636_13725 [Anaerolineales bacterium]|nr:hypothetical protein [Anaerolineales bacterium]